MEPLADRCRANGWRIEAHSHPHFGQIVFVRGGAGLMTVETDRRPFASPSELIVPVNTVQGFDYGMDSDGWVLTVAEPACAINCNAPPSKCRERKRLSPGDTSRSAPGES